MANKLPRVRLSRPVVYTDVNDMPVTIQSTPDYPWLYAGVRWDDGAVLIGSLGVPVPAFIPLDALQFEERGDG